MNKKELERLVEIYRAALDMALEGYADANDGCPHYVVPDYTDDRCANCTDGTANDCWEEYFICEAIKKIKETPNDR